MVELVETHSEQLGIYTVSKDFLTQHCLIRKGEWVTPQWKCLAHHLHLVVIELGVTMSGADWRQVPPDMMQWERHITLVLLLPKRYKLNLIVRKLAKPKLINILQSHWSIFFKMSRLRKTKSIEKFFQLKETKVTSQLNEMYDSGLNFGQENIFSFCYEEH